MIALLIAFILIVIAFFVIITIGEGDLTVLFYERFGKPLDVLEGQVIWITGASSGIGEALAYLLAEYKAKLVLSGRNNQELQKVKSSCLEISKSLQENDILVVPFDIGDYSAHEPSFQKVLDHFGKLDILVNNAGRSQRAEFKDIELKVHEEILRTNTLGPVMLSKTVLPHFLEKKSGHFVITSSTVGVLGGPFSATYTASKHALHGFFESLRIEVLFDNIEVTIVCPGPIESKIVDNACTGKLGETYKSPTDPSTRRAVKVSRCAKLMACAIVNKLDHAWISNQPILTTHYLAQYTPSFFRGFLLKKFFSRKLVQRLRDGK